MIKVVIPASGAGLRMGANQPKQFLPLEGQAILQRTIAQFENMAAVDEIVVAVPEGYVHTVQSYGFSKVKHIVEGGQDRGCSVLLALEKLPATTEVVLIHDGVRPFVTEALAMAVAEAAQKHGAAIACTPVTNTIKAANPQGEITQTLDRSQLWSVQTPQGFTYHTIMNAYQAAQTEGIQATDDSALVERLGLPVHVVPSSPKNIKITTEEDLVLGAAILKTWFTPTPPMADIKLPLEKNQTITIYTDGACSGNPGPGGYGVVMIAGEHRKELSGGEAQTTNNRMEILGVIIALEALKQPRDVVLFSDSKYVVDAIEKGWVVRWRQNGWMRNSKDPALNVDLWERMLPLLDKHQVKFQWIKGHAGHPENERCDQLAREAIGRL